MRIVQRIDHGIDGGRFIGLWSGEPYESTQLLRTTLVGPRPCVGFGVNSSAEHGWTLHASLLWSLYVTLPWLPVPRWLDDRETSVELDLDEDARLPSLWLRVALLSSMMDRRRGLHGMVDLIALVLGRVDVVRDDVDTWVGELDLPGAMNVERFPVTITVHRWSARWRRQWWPATHQWGYTLALIGDGEGWYDPRRRHKGSISMQSAGLPSDMLAGDVAEMLTRTGAK